MKKENHARVLRQFVSASVALVLILRATVIAADDPEVPVVDAGLGRCSASFTVTDNEKKPIYNAKIDVIVRYGFMGLHKSELQVGTSSGGKARVAGLPERVKKPLEFHITSGSLSKTIVGDPAAKCDAAFDVTLGAN